MARVTAPVGVAIRNREMQTAVNSAGGLEGVTVNDPNITSESASTHSKGGSGWTINPGSPGNYTAASPVGNVYAVLSGVPDGSHTYEVTFGSVTVSNSSFTVGFGGGSQTTLVDSNPGPYTITGGTPFFNRLACTNISGAGTATIEGPITLTRTA